MDCSTPGFSVYHQLPELVQTHVHWVGVAISSSVIPFSSCLQSFPASGSFQMSQFFTSSGQSTAVSASASVLPMNIQDWLPLEWTSWYVTSCFLLLLRFKCPNQQKTTRYTKKQKLWLVQSKKINQQKQSVKKKDSISIRKRLYANHHKDALQNQRTMWKK